MVALGHVFAGAMRQAADSLKVGIGQFDKTVNETVVRLAVTGLSRSGKTVFITSMIQNLLAMGAGLNALPELAGCLHEDGKSRLKSVTVVAAGAEVIPWFDFPAKLELLAAENPVWPRPTDDLATISLMLEMSRKNNKFLGTARLRLEILDYPGEWLLDLPLLNMSFQEWSRRTLAMMARAPREGCFAEFNGYVRDRLSADEGMEEASVRGAHQLFKKGLAECREAHGLQYLQPGRFICPGPKGSDLPFLWFFPMDLGGMPPRAGSVGEQLVKRFEKYKAYVKEEFFDPYFNHFNRQIMLVDVLTALYKGRIVFNDTREAICDIAKALASQRVKRLAIAATKADHVPAFSRSNLTSLLKTLSDGAFNAKKADEVGFFSVASIDSTTQTIVKMGDREVSAVAGMVEGKLRPYYVGEIPPFVPEDTYFDHALFQLPGFQPRRFERGEGAVRSVGMDQVLKAVIGGDL